LPLGRIRDFQRRPDVTDGRIGGIGFSVGGEMMLQAAASNTVLIISVGEFYEKAAGGEIVFT
jgi:dienelactone hydrolase